MGRHETPRSKGRLAPPVVIALLVVPLLVAGGLVWWLVGGGGDSRCADVHTVAVAVAPEAEPVAREVLAEPIELSDGSCAVADVTPQEPLQTVGDLGALDAQELPRVWVPDSSLWMARSGDVAVESAGSLGTSPVVVATSRARADALGWTDEAPSWADALTSGEPVAVPDLAADAEGLAALAAVRTSLGGSGDADSAVVQAVLAAERGGADPESALTAAVANADDAPLVPATEQQVLARNAVEKNSSLVAVYPSDGSPVLGYPVLRVGAPAAADRAAVDTVVQALTSRSAHAAARKAGFRGEDGAAPEGAGPDSGTQEPAPKLLDLAPDQVQGLQTTLASLAKPSRMLAVFDVSASMGEAVGSRTRATLARDAAKSALGLLPDSSAIGLWVFASRLNGGRDWVELVPTRGLTEDVGGRSQREVLDQQLDTITERLRPGGTGLYDTAMAAIRTGREHYDPEAVNSVVLITDGRDEDRNSIGRQKFLDTLRAETDPDRPVRVIGVALGPDADLAALQQIAEAAGGSAYSAVDPDDLRSVLFDALRQRG